MSTCAARRCTTRFALFQLLPRSTLLRGFAVGEGVRGRRRPDGADPVATAMPTLPPRAAWIWTRSSQAAKDHGMKRAALRVRHRGKNVVVLRTRLTTGGFPAGGRTCSRAGANVVAVAVIVDRATAQRSASKPKASRTSTRWAWRTSAWPDFQTRPGLAPCANLAPASLSSARPHMGNGRMARAVTQRGGKLHGTHGDLRNSR